MTGPLEETPQEAAESFQPPQPDPLHKQHARLSIIAGASGITALVVLFVLLFSAFNNRSIASGSAPPIPTVPAGWQRYIDPDGHFIISIPKGWTAERQSITIEAGDPQRGGITFHNTQVTFGGPPWGQNTITVGILVEPIESDQARQWICHNLPVTHTNATLAGLPALHSPLFGWLLNSSGAHFQIGYSYPNYKGDAVITSNSPTPTPMPPGFYEKGQKDFQTMLASFMPTPDTPLQCS